MLEISFATVLVGITLGWILIRCLVWGKTKRLTWRRELELLLVYVCIAVVARFTFFPFGKVDGSIQPLLFDPERILPFRLNVVPVVHLMDYPERREALRNLIGNTAMFVPVGAVWGGVFRKTLNTHCKVMAAGVGYSLCIEILQLPFFDRVTDIDDLLLNSLGFGAGYLLLLLARAVGNAWKRWRARQRGK